MLPAIKTAQCQYAVFFKLPGNCIPLTLVVILLVDGQEALKGEI